MLSLAFSGQALVPGRRLSNSDSLYFGAPWTASRPADLHRASEISDEPDWPLQYQPWLRYNRSEFPAIPLWNPYLMAGRPYFGDAQSAASSVFTVPSYVLPYDLANGLIAGAMLAGLVFGFGMPLVTWMLELNLSAVWALIPWLLLATGRVVGSGLLPVCGLAAAAAAVFLAAHPESIVQAFAAVLGFLIFQVVRKPRRSAHRRRGARAVPLRRRPAARARGGGTSDPRAGAWHALCSGSFASR